MLAYECFVDEAESRFAWHEVFANAGLLEEIPAALDFDVTIALGDVDDDARTVLEKMGFAILKPHAGVVR